MLGLINDVLDMAKIESGEFALYPSRYEYKEFAGAIDAMIRARTEKGEPRDIFSFINNLEISLVNKKAVESLIKAGACDCLSDNRAAMLAIYESLVESARKQAEAGCRMSRRLTETSSWSWKRRCLASI